MADVRRSEALSAPAIAEALKPKSKLTLVVPKKLERKPVQDVRAENATRAIDALANFDAEVKKFEALAKAPTPKVDTGGSFEMRVTRSARNYVVTSDSSLVPRIVLLLGSVLTGAASYGIGLAYYTFMIAPILAAATLTPPLFLLGLAALFIAYPVVYATFALGVIALMTAAVAFFAPGD